MVIDPSLRDRPLTIDEWEATMGGAASSDLTPSSVYVHRPDLKVPGVSTTNLSQTDFPAEARTAGAFSDHIKTRNTALGR